MQQELYVFIFYLFYLFSDYSYYSLILFILFIFDLKKNNTCLKNFKSIGKFKIELHRTTETEWKFPKHECL